MQYWTIGRLDVGFTLFEAFVVGATFFLAMNRSHAVIAEPDSTVYW